MRTTHHAGASAMLDIAYARESAEKEAHHHNQTTKQPGTRRPRQRPTQRKQTKRTKGAQEMQAHDHVDDIEDIVPDQMPTEYESLFELSEHHPRFGHRMASKRKRGKKGGGGTGVTDADASDDSVAEDDYSIGVDAQNAEMLAELMLCAGSDDSGGTDNHEGTEEERRFDRLASIESETAQPQQGSDASFGQSRHPAPALVRPTGAERAGRGFGPRSNAEPKASREWAEAAFIALVQRNLADPATSLQIPARAGAASPQRATPAGNINVLPAAARVMQRFLAHQATVSSSTAANTRTRLAEPPAPGTRPANRGGIGAVSRKAAPADDASAPTRNDALAVPYAATIEAVRQRLVDNSTVHGIEPIPRDKLGHTQELFNLTVVLFHLALHTPRRHLQLGAVRARRRILNRRLIGAD